MITCPAANYQDGDAPVSYPYLWNIWKFDWVQYNGSVSQPLARNVGEALGVGAVTPLISAPCAGRFRHAERYPQFGGHPRPACASNTRCNSCVRRNGPRRFSAPSTRRRPRGADSCSNSAAGNATARTSAEAESRTQANAPLKPSHDMEWRMEVIPLDHIGTDPECGEWGS